MAPRVDGNTSSPKRLLDLRPGTDLGPVAAGLLGAGAALYVATRAVRSLYQKHQAKKEAAALAAAPAQHTALPSMDLGEVHPLDGALARYEQAMSAVNTLAVSRLRTEPKLNEAADALLEAAEACLNDGNFDAAVLALNTGYLSKAMGSSPRAEKLAALIEALQGKTEHPHAAAHLNRLEGIAVHYRRAPASDAALSALQTSLNGALETDVASSLAKGDPAPFLAAMGSREAGFQLDSVETVVHLGRVHGNRGEGDAAAACYDAAQQALDLLPPAPQGWASIQLLRTQAHLNLNRAGLEEKVDPQAAMGRLRENVYALAGMPGCVEVFVQSLYNWGRLLVSPESPSAVDIGQAKDLFEEAKALATDPLAEAICDQQWGEAHRKSGPLQHDEARAKYLSAMNTFAQMGDMGSAGLAWTERLMRKLPVESVG